VSDPPPDETEVDHAEVNRREERDVAPVGPTRSGFSLMTGMMVGAVVLILAWFAVTQLMG
jgi:hypothetical protein